MQTPANAETGPSPPAQCDMCGAPMRLASIEPHPEKPGQLYVFECTACRLPMVKYAQAKV
jgi:hypothetical protein